MNRYIEYRREFHKYPELGWEEIRTSARIAEILEKMGYRNVLMGTEVVNPESIIEPERRSEEEKKSAVERAVRQGADPAYAARTEGFPGVIAVLDTGRKGPVTAFRFDIDALPYEEPQRQGYRPYEEGYISVNRGRVHACGHDAHTACGLGIAEQLLSLKEALCGRIKFIFQPAEETFCGAQSIVDRGHLDDADHFLALHVALTAEGKPMVSHSMSCGNNDFLSDRQLDVTFHGRAAHPCGASQDGKNALLAACTAALNIHTIAPHEEGFCRVNVGKLQAGAAANTIAPEAKLSVEFRGETPNISRYVERRVFDCLNGAAKTYDLTYSYLDYGEVPAGKSDSAMMDIMKEVSENVAWFDNVYYEGNVSGTDDASIMMTKVQENGGIAAYVGIGTDADTTVHCPDFDFDEECIPAGIELFVKAAERIHKR